MIASDPRRFSRQLLAAFATLACLTFTGGAQAIQKVVLNDGSVIGFAHPDATVGKDGKINIAVVGYDATGTDACRTVGCDIYYMQVRSDGKVLIDASKVNTSASGSHGKPRIAMTPDNKVVISWHAGASAGAAEALRYALVDPSLNTNAVGSAMSASAIVQTEFQVGTSASADSHDLVVDSTGLAIAVMNQGGSGLKFVTWNPATHTVVTAEKNIAADAGNQEPLPAIGLDSNDNVHIVFSSGDIDGNAPAGYMMVDKTGAVLIDSTALYDGSLGAVFPHGAQYSLFVDGQDRVHITYGDKRNTSDASSWCDVCAQGGTMFYTVLDPGRAPQDGTASDMATLRVGKETTIGSFWYGRSFQHDGAVHFFTGTTRGARGEIVHGAIGMSGGMLASPTIVKGTNVQGNSYYGRHTITSAGGAVIWAEGVFNTPLLNGTNELVMAHLSSFSTSTTGSGGVVPAATLLVLGFAALARRRRAH